MLPSPVHKKKTQVVRTRVKPPTYLLTSPEGLQYVKSVDADFKKNKKISKINQRQVARLIEKEKRDDRFRRSGCGWRALNPDYYFP